MKKVDIIKAMIKLIKEKASEMNVEIIDKGCGHAFEGSFWDGILDDDSNIPEVFAKNDKYGIWLRPFWNSIELCIKRKIEKDEELLIIIYGDSIEINGKYFHTDDFHVCEVRVDCHGNYKSCIDEVYEIIEAIENRLQED